MSGDNRGVMQFDSADELNVWVQYVLHHATASVNSGIGTSMADADTLVRGIRQRAETLMAGMQSQRRMQEGIQPSSGATVIIPLGNA